MAFEIDFDVLIIIINFVILLIALFLIFRNYRTMEYLRKVYAKRGFVVTLKEAFKPKTYVDPPTKVPQKGADLDFWHTKHAPNFGSELETIERELFGMDYAQKHSTQKKRKKHKSIEIHHQTVRERALDSELQDLNTRVHGYKKVYEKALSKSKRLRDINALLVKLGGSSKQLQKIPSTRLSRSSTYQQKALGKELERLEQTRAGKPLKGVSFLRHSKRITELGQDLELVNAQLVALGSSAKKPAPPVHKTRTPTRKKLDQSVLDREMHTLNTRIQGYTQNHERIVRKSKKIAELGKDLDAIDAQIASLEGAPKIRTIEAERVKSHHRFGQHRSIPLGRKEISQELKEINALLKKEKTGSDSFVGKLKKRETLSSRQKKGEELALRLVRKISHKIEGPKPVAPNELLWVQQKLAQVQKKMKKGER